MKQQTFDLDRHYELKTQELLRYNSQTAVIQLPHYKYVDKVLRSNSYEELMWRFMEADSPTKEISESYAAFSNMKKICNVSNYNWLHIGDGGYTRTASIFAFFSKSLNFSIDPALNMDKFNKWQEKYRIQRIFLFAYKFEEFLNPPKEAFGNILPYNICCVHAHVELEKLDKHFPNWKYLYTNPCCYPQLQEFSLEYMKENNIYKMVDKLDLGILSERRKVIIYKKFK